ncbi:MAG: hypothetical protein GY861_26465 [bacterium]|nr:hypothetical protein [bacterium]
MREIIIGQEAAVPEYGLGRVISYSGRMFIEVKPYVCGYVMKFDPKNVRLIKLDYEEAENM